MSDHQAGESWEMEGAERGGKSFVVSGEATKTRRPSEASLHYPAAWQQDKAALGLSMFDHFQLDATDLEAIVAEWVGGLSTAELLDALERAEIPGARSLTSPR